MTDRVLITGANGMLAWDLKDVFSKAFPQSTIAALDRQTLDITSSSSIEAALEKHRPQIVFNTAAYTQVDGAETDRQAAHAINAQGPELLAKLCAAADAKLVHFSTDQVFDGTKGAPQTEDETPNPLNHYAATKLEGEQAALQNERALVLRVQWLYGQRKDRFSPLKTKTVFTPFADQIGAPTWTREIARTLIPLLKNDTRGLFHFSYDDAASWADVFQFVKQTWGLNLELKPQTTAGLNLPAKRPLYSVLSNAKLKKALGVSSLGSWKTPLREFLDIVGEVS